VSRWERGDGGIDGSKLATLADVFSSLLGRPISVDYLLGREEHSFGAQKDTETVPRMYPVGMTRTVKVFESIPTAEPPKQVDEEEVAVTDLQECSGLVFFLVVSDDSMAGAGIHKGHRALIDPQAPVKDGDIVLVAVAGEEFASLRQVYREGERVLVTANGLGQRPSVH
jgi:SOS-response transcriptional repressor LexA